MALLDTNGLLQGSALGTALTQLLMTDDIQPGSAPSYQLCKLLLEFHPIAKKMVDAPIAMAQSQPREVTVADGAEDEIRRAFWDEWNAIRADEVAAQTMRLARAYGTSALVPVVDGQNPGEPLDLKTLWKRPEMSLNALDPLNTAGSSTSMQGQDPNSLGFQKTRSGGVVVSGVGYHPSRTCVLVNEAPLYIAYTPSAFGFTGRSVYQRALFPLKTFVQTMRTDDLLVRKAGVVVAKMDQPGSVVDNVMAKVMGAKRALARQAITEDVLSIGPNDSVESMDLKNAEGPYTLARRNAVENIALAADMPAKILNSETFAEGFGEGTEDAKAVARYVDGVRVAMRPVYDFLDAIVQYRAWTPAFFERVRDLFPEAYGGMTHETAFYRWRNSFAATWPSLLTEPDSEKLKAAESRAQILTARFQVLHPLLDPENKNALIAWYVDATNDMKDVTGIPFVLDVDALESYVPPTVDQTGGQDQDEDEEPPAPGLFSRTDSLVALPPRRRA